MNTDSAKLVGQLKTEMFFSSSIINQPVRISSIKSKNIITEGVISGYDCKIERVFLFLFFLKHFRIYNVLTETLYRAAQLQADDSQTLEETKKLMPSGVMRPLTSMHSVISHSVICQLGHNRMSWNYFMFNCLVFGLCAN